MTAPWRPRLRDDVAIERTDGRVSLRDAALGHVLPAGRLTQALLPRLDGTQPVAALVGEVAAETGEAPVEVEQALRALLLLHLLEGAGTATVERARAVAAGAPLAPLETLTDARFGCQGSGQCCRVYRPGPLTDVDVAALEAAAPALRAALPELPDEPWIEQRPGDDGQTWRFLRRTAGRCLFLQEDGLCGVHATCGRAAKPEACRLFPFQLVHTLQALRVFDVSECSQFAVARTEGPAHAAFAEEVRFLAPERPRLFHPLTLLDGGTPCDYGPVGALEGRLQEVVRAESDAATRLRRCAGLARAFVDGLRRCPLAAGEPDATVAAALAAEPAPLPSPDAAELALALEACDAALTAALAEGDEPDAPTSRCSWPRSERPARWRPTGRGWPTAGCPRSWSAPARCRWTATRSPRCWERRWRTACSARGSSLRGACGLGCSGSRCCTS